MNNKGFSLIELMIAMVILGMGLMAAVSLHYSTSRNNTNGNLLTMAHMAAKEELEGFRSKDIWNLDEGVFTKKVGVVALETTITKDPNNIRLGRVVVIAKVRNKTVRYETFINNNKQAIWRN